MSMGCKEFASHGDGLLPLPVHILFVLNYGRGLPYDLREGIAPNHSSFGAL